MWCIGWASPRLGPAARQLVAHGHVAVNGKACDIPSMLFKAGDTVAIKSRPRSLQLVKLNLQDSPAAGSGLSGDASSTEPPEARMARLPIARRRGPAHSRHPRAIDHRIRRPLMRSKFGLEALDARSASVSRRSIS